MPLQSMQLPVQPAIAPPELALVPSSSYPLISDWLWHCDLHDDCTGRDLKQYALKFSEEEYICINQLNHNHIKVEQLAEWLNIKKGIADLLIGYAKEDCKLVKNRRFRLVLLENFGREI